MVDLSKNEYQGEPSPEVASALSGAELRFYSRTSSLKQRIAKELSISVDWVHLGNGAEEVLVELFQSLVRFPKEERKVLMPDLTWPFYDRYLADADAIKVEFPLTADFSYDTKTIVERLKTENPRMTVICSPNNPTSSVISSDSLEAILENATGIVVVDQTYLGFAKEEDYLSLLPKHKNLVIVRSFSKFYGLAGARIGYGLIHPETAANLCLPQRMLGLSTLIESLGIAALDSHSFYKEQASRIAKDRDIITDALNRTEVFFAPPSKTNFVFFKGSQKEIELFEKILTTEGIKIYVFPEGKYRGWVRFGIGNKEHTESILKTLKQFPS